MIDRVGFCSVQHHPSRIVDRHDCASASVQPSKGGSARRIQFLHRCQQWSVFFFLCVKLVVAQSWHTEGGISTFHRADFQDVLLKHLPRSCKVYCSKRLCSYHQSQSGPVKLAFEDGSTALCDILIGADGIKSPTRRSLLRESARLKVGEQSPSDLLSCVDPIWTGTLAYRALISADTLRKRSPGHRALKGPVAVGHLNVIFYPGLVLTICLVLGQEWCTSPFPCMTSPAVTVF